MTPNCLELPGEVYTQIVKITLPRQSLACLPAERALLSHVVAVGRIFDPWPNLMCSLRQEQGIVPPAPALLHIHTPRAESNKRRLREISCLTWEKQLIVRRHGQTMLQLWEHGNGQSRFCMWCVQCWERKERRWGWIYPCERACRPSSAWRRIF